VSDELVERLRRIVGAEVGVEVTRREKDGVAPLDAADRREIARSILRRELDGQWRAAQQRGAMGLTPEEEDRVIAAALAGLFSQLPGLDSYLARPDVTDIFVIGYDNVRVRTLDGRETQVPPIAASDEDLIVQIQALARKGGRLGLGGEAQIEKEFSPARPLLDLNLSDGSRLAAVAWVAARPSVSVRRHALVDADQSTLVLDWKMYDAGVASLLGAAVRARLNVLVAGGMGRGKTTLMRALLHECPPDERIIVLEQESELKLGLDPGRHGHVVELVERPANMEGQGSITLADLTWAVKRHAPDRIVVGEVRGPEVIYMLEAASDGIAGTLCTLHAKSSRQTFEKLVSYARRGGVAFDRGDVLQTAAHALDLIIYVDRTPGGRRVVSEITQVCDYDPDSRQVITNEWFVPGADRAAVANRSCPIPVHMLDLLVDHGYDPSLHPDGAPGGGVGSAPALRGGRW
jgi:Flp pilus assembly CpaF family ATPase